MIAKNAGLKEAISSQARRIEAEKGEAGRGTIYHLRGRSGKVYYSFFERGGLDGRLGWMGYLAFDEHDASSFLDVFVDIAPQLTLELGWFPLPFVP